MPSNIFNRGPAPQPPGGSGGVGYSLRSNGYASVGFAGGGPDSPLVAMGGGKGRPVATLKSVKVTLEGEAGSLRRGEFVVVVYNASELETVLTGIGKIGCSVTYTIGRSGPGAGAGNSWTLVNYKNSFQSDKDGRYTITVQSVGKGNEILKKDGIALPNGGKGRKFKKFASFFGFPFIEEVGITSLIDWMLWEALDGTIAGFPLLLSPDSGTGDGSNYVQFIAPTGVAASMAPESKVGVGANRLVYFSLKFIIDNINKGLPAGAKPIKLDAQTETQIGGVHLISGDPLNVLIKNDPHTDYPAGTPPTATQVISDLIASLLGVPSGIFTSAAQMAPVQGSGADCGNIYISYAALKSIETSLGGGQKSAAQKRQEALEDNVATKMTLEGFLSSIFGIISEATGGWIELDFVQDPAAWVAGERDAQIVIINKKDKLNPASEAVYDDVSGEGGVREATINGDVPEGWQAEAFGQAGVSSGCDVKVEKTKTEKPDFLALKSDLANMGYDASQAGGLKAALRKTLSDIDNAEAANKTNRPYPIGVAVTLNGVHGIEFGHNFTISSLSPTRWGASPKTTFMVTRVEHTVEGQDWVTVLTSTAKLTT